MHSSLTLCEGGENGEIGETETQERGGRRRQKKIKKKEERNEEEGRTRKKRREETCGGQIDSRVHIRPSGQMIFLHTPHLRLSSHSLN